VKPPPAAEVPLAVVTVTVSAPAAWAGDVAVIEVDELTVYEAADAPPRPR